VTTTPPYRLFEVVGIELEYPVVDRDLAPQCVVEPAFRRIHGRPTSDIEFDNVGFSNELAAHVFEIKTVAPERSLLRAEGQLVRGLRRFATTLERHFGARLLPTGMHPFMHPEMTELWPRSGRRIYRTYDRVFGIRGHGWLNVQASHVNLPFGTEEETMRLHTAVSLLLPYVPALSASSPIYAGRLGPHVDNRLAFYRTNQRRIPVITGTVIPEYIGSYAEYRRRILTPIYRALDHVDGGDVLQHEWVNSRGAIMRFMRRAIEIRVIDMQECVQADIAIAVFVRSALTWIVRALTDQAIVCPDHRVLVRDFDSVVARGRAASVRAPHFRTAPGRTTARAVLESLLERAETCTPAAERPYLALVSDRLQRGNISERISTRVRARAPRAGSRQRDHIRGIYEELATCLVRNEPWPG
jgi:gamma-glutamyl:cysteine ligase YbdK (ATP-grasp superfamily)